jgi:hypothetical protein
MSEFKRGTFEDMLVAAHHCRNLTLDLPMLALLYTTLDALAWAVYESTEKSIKHRLVKICDTYLFPNAKIKCTSLELYAARSSILHKLGWESELSQKGQARSVTYSFGVSDSTVAQEASKIIPASLGTFVHIHADDLYEAIAFTWKRVMDAAKNEPSLATRLTLSKDKQYASLNPASTEVLYKKLLALKNRNDIQI